MKSDEKVGFHHFSSLFIFSFFLFLIFLFIFEYFYDGNQEKLGGMYFFSTNDVLFFNNKINCS